ncbi:hypothetical protein ETI06_13050 [Macrococcoides goetzii]|nr:hypothetical protein [Macrococcus goetzii]TDM39466.1 hypothetical protein ETI08_13490 [Macrococcus goetzii]TDM45173.1 hypothetical protein ETI06_13050 [Macrococcus goetzii]
MNNKLKVLLATTTLVSGLNISSVVSAEEFESKKVENYTDINQVNEVREKLGIPTRDNGEITIDYNDPVVVKNSLEDKNSVRSLSLFTGIKKIRSFETCGSTVLHKDSGTGTFSTSINKTVSTTISSDFGATLKSVNASLGTSISKSYSVTSSTSYTPPKGKLGVIEAYANQQNISFGRYLLGKKTGSGELKYATGVCWNKYY